MTADFAREGGRSPLRTVAPLAAGCFFLGFFLYLPTVAYTFLWDDTQFIVQNNFLRDPGNMLRVFGHFFSFSDAQVPIPGAARPMWIASLVWNHWLGGLDPSGFHLTNVVLHGFNAALAFCLAWRLGLNKWAAFVVGAAFAAHPVHAEAVAAVGFRTDLLSLLFVQISVLAFWTAAPLRDEQIPSRAARSAAYLFSLACYTSALLSKEIAAPLPAVLIAADALWRRHVRRRLLLYVPFFLVLGFYAYQHSSRFRYQLSESVTTARAPLGVATAWAQEIAADRQNADRPLAPPPAEAPSISVVHRDPVANAATMLPVLARYIGKMVLPLSYCADYPVPVRTSLGQPVPILSFVVLLGIAALFIAWTTRLPAAAWGLAWFGLFLTPVSNILPLANLMADRYLYVPSLGFLLAGTAAGAAAFQQFRLSRAGKRAVWGSAVLLLTVWMGQALVFARTWRDDLTLFTKAVECSPRNFRGWYNLALAYHRRGVWDKAIAHYRRAAEVGAHRKEIYVNLGRCYEELGDRESAENAYREALRRDPRDLLALTNLGLLHHRLKNFDRAADYLNRALQASDRSAVTAFHLANVYLDMNDERAQHYYRMALEWNPRLALAHYRLGLSHLQRGDKALALRIWKRHRDLFPDDRESAAAIERHLKEMP